MAQDPPAQPRKRRWRENSKFHKKDSVLSLGEVVPTSLHVSQWSTAPATFSPGGSDCPKTPMSSPCLKPFRSLHI